MTSHFRQRIAGAAVTCGLALGLWGALAENPFDDWGGEQGLAASVNGASVTADDLTLATEAVAADKRNALTDADRARILARLIDEELLIQRGIEVGIGSACQSKSGEKSPALKALGLADKDTQQVLRISFSRHSRVEEIQALVQALHELAPQLAEVPA